MSDKVAPGMVLLFMCKQNGGNNPGETAGYLPHIAEKLIADGVAVLANPDTGRPYDSDESSIEAESGSNGGDTSSDAGEEGDHKFDEKTDPFIIDGLSKTSSQKLHNAGLHTPDDVRKYLQDGKSLADLSVSASDSRKAALLYVQPQ